MFEWLMSLAMSVWPFLLQVLAGGVYHPQPSLPYCGPCTPTAQVSEVWQDSVQQQPPIHTREHELRGAGVEECCEAAATATNSYTDTLMMNGKKRWGPRYNTYYDDNYEQLRRQFPVSSGTEHRAIEGPQAPPPHLQLKLDEDWSHDTTPRRDPVPTRPRFGLKMLQKMGWSPGEGLGKNKEGTLEPLVPDGLFYSQPEQFPKKQPVSLVEDLSGKHPVMALTELCTKFGWSAPKFEVVDNSGPDHKKNFLMKVIVNGQEFQPSTAAPSKKQAKADAAALFLESIGLYKGPKTSQ
ncbi:protein Son-like isoform X2 [Scylla paramamosain]|uniref:protein Son-like isoform X2 n=1 Tax=Scylla paramamosain TaxID=85552 RepID=UPI0030832086